MQRELVCKTHLSKAIAALLATIAAVALPQIFHGLGAVSGLGSALGETFLPMHLPVLLVGFFAGPWAALAAGIFSPLVSFALTSLLGNPMPALAMLPYMTIELGVYGLTAGLLATRAKRLPAIVSLLIAQLAGRAVRAICIVIGVYALGSPVNVAVIWNSLLTGLPGLVLQWTFVPLLVAYVGRRN